MTESITLAPSQSLPPTDQKRRFPHPALLVAAGLLLSIAQILSAGYHLGAGNQSIQIPFLLHAINPSLYPHDAMVQQTLGDYPTFFFRILAWIVPVLGLQKTYFVLHLATAFAVIAGVYLLARAMFDDAKAAMVAVAMLAAGHHHALAGDDLYSQGFTHTWAVFPIAIFAMFLIYRQRPIAASLLAGIIFNLHALTGAYLLAMFIVWALGTMPTRVLKLALLVGIFLAAASPTLTVMAHTHQTFDAEWIRLTRIRSADHSFPSTWWDAGRTDIPRFAILIALAALSFGYQIPAAIRRTTLCFACAFAILFSVGIIFADIHPIPTILRAQLFRSSRLLFILLICQIAFSIVSAFRISSFPKWRRRIEAISAMLTFAAIAIPQLIGLLPLALACATIVALINGRLSAIASAVSALALLVCLAAWRGIHFDLFSIQFSSISLPAGTSAAMLFCAIGISITAAAISFGRKPRLFPELPMIVICYFLMAISFYSANTKQPDSWTDVQLWAQQLTPPDSLFLTPIQPGGFRVASQRSVVGEWRDGTQIYFSARFAPHWWDTMNALQPGMIYDEHGHALARGKSLETMDDSQIIALCKQFDATHVVLPAESKHQLKQIYANDDWAIDLPEIPTPTAPLPAARGDGKGEPVVDASELIYADILPPATQPSPLDLLPPNTTDRFMIDTVAPNIEKYRKSDLTIRIVDTAGKPVANIPFQIHQMRSSFNFACSLNFFSDPIPPGESYGDFKPPVPVKPVELDYFRQLFNSSVIPFSAKWLYIEPAEGKFNYTDLDMYVDWCTKHNIDTEFHFLSGYAPMWERTKPPAEQTKLFLDHARDMATRYGAKIKYWQVTNEGHQFNDAPAVIAEMRKLAPDAKLGISHCTEFFAPHNMHPDPPQMVGLDELKSLKQQGIKLDFFAIHGHRPFGIWADPKVIYETVDLFANQGVRIHISEFSCPMTGNIIGGYRAGKWTPQLQAEYYSQYFATLFSHPAVDLINLWEIGPITWQPQAGLLDEKDNPKPVFAALDDLFNHRWRTNIDGNLGEDGATKFRGFHGGYELTLQLLGGDVKATFELSPENSTLRLVLDRDKRTLLTQK